MAKPDKSSRDDPPPDPRIAEAPDRGLEPHPALEPRAALDDADDVQPKRVVDMLEIAGRSAEGAEPPREGIGH